MAKPPVLIVDDSPANLKVARVALEADGYEVRTAADGEEAWRILEGFKPSSILMDLQLPGLDGFELTRRIKADPALRHIPIIAVTAYAMKGDRERALAVGCDDYIAKPVDPILLPALVATHLPRSTPAAPVNGDADGRILVIEDNPATRKLLRVTLESEGYQVWATGEARAALQWVEHHRPRLVLQDLMLPDMDGLELVRQLRAAPNGASVPIVCLSGFIGRIDDAKAMAHSFSALLIKPADPVRVIEVVRGQLETPRPPPPTAAAASSGARVLLVDDDPLQRRLAEFQLAGAGLRVTAVASAKQAIAEAERERPDAIVSDVLMPDVDGFELCLSIRRHPLLSQVPVILTSSHYADRGDRALADTVGADALVSRSGDRTDLLDQVRRALEQPNVQRTAADSTEAGHAIARRTALQLERQLLVNRRLTQQCMFHGAQLSVLARVADALTRHAKLEEVLADALSVCLDLAGISKGALYLLKDGTFVPEHHFGFGVGEMPGLLRFFDHAALLDEIVVRGEVCAIPSPELAITRAEDFLSRAGIRAALIVPVVWAEQTRGALLLGARTAEVTGPDAMTFARVLGGQLGQAIGLADTFERLHTSEQKFRGLVDSMDIVTILDREQRITDLYGRKLEGAPAERADMLGKRLEDISPHDREAHAAAHAKALDGESVLYEWSHPGPNARHLQTTAFPVRDASGSVRSVMRVTRDITEQKYLHSQVSMSDRMASVGVLAAGVAHEINSPLMTVLGNLQLALTAPNDDTETPHEQPELLRDAFEAAQRAEAIVRDLRLFSRAGEEHVGPVDVHVVLDSTLRLVRNEIRHRARLVRALAPVPPVRANASRLGQVFLNLLLNAAQAIPDGRADAHEIRVSTYVDERGRVIVEVADTFASSSGRGNVYRVQLPASGTASGAVSPGPAVAAPKRRGKLMVIDDDALLCTLLRRSLQREHDVVCFSDAREALQSIDAGATFDLILCDVMMPHMTGAEFHRELERRHPMLAQRTEFLTGGAFTPAARDFVERLGRSCLEKPLDLRDLRKFINDRVK